MNQTMKQGHLKNWLQNQEPPLYPSICSPNQLIQTAKDIKSVCSGQLGTSRSIDVFFKIIQQSQLDRHGVYRETFWKKYLEAGYINQSWLILAPKAAQLAIDSLGVKKHQFATIQKNRKIDEKHAVLLMRLNHIVIAEWSHTGKCRFWAQGTLKAPKLFQKSYVREQLIDYADHVQQHYFSAKGLWQKDAHTWLQDNAQVPPLKQK